MSISLKSIQFIGFKNKNRIGIVHFNRKDISIIYGLNGIGKTSFLKGIQSFLSQDECYLKQLKVQKIICSYEFNVRSNGKNYTEEESITVKFNQEKNSFDWKGFEKCHLATTSSLSIAIERGTSSISSINIDASNIENFLNSNHGHSNSMAHFQKPMKTKMAIELYEYLSQISKINSINSKNLNQDFSGKHTYLESLETKDLENLIIESYKTGILHDARSVNRALIEAFNMYVQMHENNSQKTILDYEKESIFRDIFRQKDRLTSAFLSLDPDFFDTPFLRDGILSRIQNIKDIEDVKNLCTNKLIFAVFSTILGNWNKESYSILQRFELLKKNFNDFLIEDKYLTVNNSSPYCVKINTSDGESHSLDDLSSGERHILTLLVCILFKGHNRDFLLIDEPEMSLNTHWQKLLLPLLKQLLPDTQIIVASHSPFIVHTKKEYLSKLEVIKNG